MKALILAGERPGGDPLARALNVPLKALLPVNGVPMIARVVEALRSVEAITEIEVVTNRERELFSIRGVTIANAEASPSLSVAAGLMRHGPPLLVTTADHALLTPAHIREFLTKAPQSADLALALVAKTIIEGRFPNAARTYWRFRDDGYSGGNLFLLQSQTAQRALEFWRQVEINRKRPWQIVRAMGIGLLIGYAFRRFDVHAAVDRAGRAIGLNVSAVALSDAMAAVDVDKVEDFELAEAVLAGRI